MKLKAYFAEFFGTFALVLIGCGVAISTYIPSQGILTVALAFGLTVSVMIYAVGGILVVILIQLYHLPLLYHTVYVGKILEVCPIPTSWFSFGINFTCWFL